MVRKPLNPRARRQRPGPATWPVRPPRLPRTPPHSWRRGQRLPCSYTPAHDHAAWISPRSNSKAFTINAERLRSTLDQSARITVPGGIPGSSSWCRKTERALPRLWRPTSGSASGQSRSRVYLRSLIWRVCGELAWIIGSALKVHELGREYVSDQERSYYTHTRTNH